MLPGVFDSFGAGGGQGQIFEMQAAEILFELLGCYRFRRQAFLRAALERGGESFLRKAPAARLRLCVEPLQERGLAVERPGEIHRRILTASFWRVFGHLSSERAKPRWIGTNALSNSCILDHKPDGWELVRKTRTTPPELAVS